MLNLLEGNKFSIEEKIKAKYERKKQIKIAKDNAITDYKKAVLENKKRLIPQLESIKELKRKMKEPAIRKRISNILIFLAVIMTVITTLTTIAGGINYRYTIFTQLTFILFVAFAQLTILIISCLKPYTAKKAPKYNNLLLILQLCLLLVSISFNYMFMAVTNNTIFIQFLVLILCFIFDIVILVMCEISFTIRLNLEFTHDKDNNLLSRILKIFSALIDYKLRVIENKISYKVKENIIENINDIDIKKYLDYAKNNIKENNQIPSYKEIAENLNFTLNKSKLIHNNLKENNLIETKDNKTFLAI